MDNKLRKRTIKLQLYKTLLTDIIFFTILLSIIVYYFFHFFFNTINLSFYDSIFYSFCLSLFFEWIYIRKYVIDEIKLDLDVVDFHNKLKYTDVNEIIQERIKLIELDIDKIKSEMRKKSDINKVFEIHLELNIGKYIKLEILKILKTILTINDKELIIVDTDGMIEFLSRSYDFRKIVVEKYQTTNTELMKNNSDDSWIGGSLAFNDEELQIILNYIICLRHRFISLIIQEYTNQSSFSPVTSDYYLKLMKYDYYCSIKDKLDFSKDIFKTIANQMEGVFKNDYKEKILLHQLHKLFNDNSLSNERLLQEKFNKAITTNYLYLLSQKRTKTNYFLDRLFNEALVSNGANMVLLHEARKNFSKYLYKKPFQNNSNNGYDNWSGIIEL